MRLFGSPTSPFVRKVMVTLHETGQTDQVEVVMASGTPLDSVRMPLAQNPLGKIPVLERNDGPALYDSRVICRYLAHRAGISLYPEPPALWSTLTLEATGDGILDSALTMVYETRLRPPEQRNVALLDGYWGKIARAVDLDGVAPKDAEKYIAKKDNARRRYQRFFSDSRFGDPHEYDLCLNSGRLGYEACAEIILAAAAAEPGR